MSLTGAMRSVWLSRSRWPNLGAGVSDSDDLNRALFLREIVILSGARSAQSKDLQFFVSSEDKRRQK